MPHPARHLATFYLGYFGLLGVLLPYLSLYFLDIGLSAYQIGVIAAIPPLIKTVTPGLWGWLADRSGTRRTLMRIACSGALITFSLLLGVKTFVLIAVVMGLYAAATSSLLPLVEATAMEAVDRYGIDYGRMRLWGSVGFIVLSMALGPVLDRYPSILVLWVILALLAFNLWNVWSLPDTHPGPKEPHPGGIRALLASPPVLVFYGVCMLMQMSHGTFYSYFSVYLEGLDYSRRSIGYLWALGVGAEVVAMLFSGRLLRWMGTRRLMLLSLALTVVRWGVMASTHHIGWLIFGQGLHAFSFGLFHVSAVTHTHRIIPEAHRATGQSLYSSISFGLGITVGMYISALLYEQVGAPVLFGACAMVAALANLLALRLQDAAPRPEPAMPPMG